MTEDPATLHTTTREGVKLAWWERGEQFRGSAPTMVFAHATGFHGRVFDAIAEFFPKRHILQLDMRGHGRSQSVRIEHWIEFARDIAAVLAEARVGAAQGIGHSMGAHSILQCAADNPDLFSRLVLFDPVVLSPELYEGADPIEDHPTSRRKNRFAGVEEMIDRFRSRDPYDLFDGRVFEDYSRFGLLPATDGEGMVLACAPETEASVYMTSRSNPGVLDAARKLACPTLVVRAKQLGMHDFKSSPTWPGLAAAIPYGRDLYRPDMTHFHPF
ncbi:alpha/beta fold hydrolase [Qipengyuania soli]|nr:alpha/beta hydrolase [Qipengyuania soli]